VWLARLHRRISPRTILPPRIACEWCAHVRELPNPEREERGRRSTNSDFITLHIRDEASHGGIQSGFSHNLVRGGVPCAEQEHLRFSGLPSMCHFRTTIQISWESRDVTTHGRIGVTARRAQAVRASGWQLAPIPAINVSKLASNERPAAAFLTIQPILPDRADYVGIAIARGLRSEHGVRALSIQVRVVGHGGA